MTDAATITAFILAGAWWQYEDGAGTLFGRRLPTLLRLAVAIGIAGLASVWALGLSWWLIPVVTVAVLNTHIGRTDFSAGMSRRMKARFGIPTAIAAIIAYNFAGGGEIGCALYAVLGFTVGPVYYLMMQTAWQDGTGPLGLGWEAWSRPWRGGALIGAVGILGL